MKHATTSLIWAIIALVLAVFLWDPDGLQIGQEIIALSPLMAKLIGGLGDVLWVGACFVFLMAGVAFHSIGRMKNEGIAGVQFVRNYIKGCGIDPDVAGMGARFGTMDKVIVATAILGLASGFWFSGLSILAMMWGIHSFSNDFKKRNKEWHEHMRATGMNRDMV